MAYLSFHMLLSSFIIIILSFMFVWSARSSLNYILTSINSISSIARSLHKVKEVTSLTISLNSENKKIL